MATTTVKVTDDWASRTTSVDNGPLPLESQVARADATHVQFIDVAPIGSESVTGTAKTFDGPWFVTTTVYVVDWPATAVDEKSSFVVLRSALRTIWVVSVAESSEGVGSTAMHGPMYPSRTCPILMTP